MSKESKRLRGRAARELRHSRKIKDAPLKAMHVARAASLKAMARNEEWLAGEPDHSAPRRSAVKALDENRFVGASRRKKR